MIQSDMFRYVIAFIAACLILVLGISCGDTTPPEPPVNITYSLINMDTTVYISWEQSPDETEDVGYIVKFGDDYWTWAGRNNSYSAYFDRGVGVHTIQVKAVDKAGNESEPAQLQFEYSE